MAMSPHLSAKPSLASCSPDALSYDMARSIAFAELSIGDTRNISRDVSAAMASESITSITPMLHERLACVGVYLWQPTENVTLLAEKKIGGTGCVRYVATRLMCL